MNNNQVRTDEKVRIAVVAISGGMLMLVQRWLLELIGQRISDTEETTQIINVFLSLKYVPAALIVFLISVAATILWYTIAVKLSQSFEPRNKPAARLQWLMICLLPVIACLVSLSIFGSDNGGLFPLFAAFLVFDIAWIFWMGTAITTPAIMANVVPLSHLWRNLWRIKD